MQIKTLLSSLLLALAAGVTAQAHAATEEPTTPLPDMCPLARQALGAMTAHVREARSDRAEDSEAPNLHAKLALELDSHLDALQGALPTQATERAQASVLLSDMRDALILMRGATHLDARRLAVQRIEDDQRLYNRVLDTLGCATTRPTAL